ncbi:PR domain zinc finger protein 8-like [Homarus americanus]|nr:PR domain zinc finger protein 8-like [Homarus americanus]
MIMEAVRGVSAASSPHTSPTKRTFDVAFLTGARDHALDTEIATPVAKVSRVSGLKVSPPTVTTSSPAPSSSPHRDDVTPGSAFTKVTRSQGSSPPQFTSTAVSSTLDALSSAWPPVSASFNAMSSLLSSGKSLAPLLAAPGLLNPGLAPFLHHPTPDRLNNNLVEEYLKSQHQLMDSKPGGGDMSASEALSRLRSSMYPTDPYKLPFSSLAYPLSGPSPADASKLSAAAAAAASPFLSQPSVSALMPPSLATLGQAAQNVCAKCNISFRMTSDLVYHMRSQHKREADPYKKRRNERLKCNICNESFRERHHLTRHMSAHQDRDEDSETK